MTVLIFIIIALSLVTAFSVQNAAPVAISFIFWKFEASLAIVIFLTLLIGIIIGSAIAFSFRISRHRQINIKNKEKG
jgi:uncharacterized integral membrane protein